MGSFLQTTSSPHSPSRALIDNLGFDYHTRDSKEWHKRGPLDTLLCIQLSFEIKSSFKASLFFKRLQEFILFKITLKFLFLILEQCQMLVKLNVSFL